MLISGVVMEDMSYIVCVLFLAVFNVFKMWRFLYYGSVASTSSTVLHYDLN